MVKQIMVRFFRIMPLGLMIFADKVLLTNFKRFGRSDKRDKLPKWISAGLSDASINVSTDMAIGKNVGLFFSHE